MGVAGQTAGSAKLSLEGVTKRFGKTVVLREVSLSIQSGELLVLLGQSGCGKSTLLRIIAGLEETSGGVVRIDGEDVTGTGPGGRDLGMVFQSYALYPHMTVRQNIAFPLTLRKVPRDECAARVEETAALLGLTDLLDRRPRALSGGQRQRVAIGRALIRKPGLLLFDEPLSNLDAALRTRMRLELKTLHKKLGQTMVYVTHDQIEAMTLATRIAVMEDGIVQQLDTPEEIYRRPQNAFVAGFVGTPPMNLIPGRLEGTSFIAPGLCLDLGGEDAHPAAAAAGGPATLGVRPEDVRVYHDASPTRIPAKVQLCEPVGERGHLHLRLGEVDLHASVEGERAFRIEVGAKLHVEIDSRRVHLFSGQSGRRLELARAAASAGT